LVIETLISDSTDTTYQGQTSVIGHLPAGGRGKTEQIYRVRGNAFGISDQPPCGLISRTSWMAIGAHFACSTFH
jgi:hypothetical protein